MLGLSARRSLRSLVCLAALVVGVADAHAAAPSAVEVVNAAQPGLVSSQPQPPVSLSARGSCGSVYTPEEADGGPSPCAEGSWPAAAGDGWGPQIEVAGGDVLVLRFDAPATEVEISSTTKFPPGLTDPDGRAVRNAWIVPRVPAAPTDDPARWTVRLPDRIDAPVAARRSRSSLGQWTARATSRAVSAPRASTATRGSAGPPTTAVGRSKPSATDRDPRACRPRLLLRRRPLPSVTLSSCGRLAASSAAGFRSQRGHPAPRCCASPSGCVAASSPGGRSARRTPGHSGYRSVAPSGVASPA